MNQHIKCLSCAVRTQALCSAIGDEAASDLARIVHRIRVPEGRVISAAPQNATSYSIIISGVVKLVNTRSDGRHQIAGLQFPADFVGRPFSNTSNLSAEAATDLELCSFSGRAFEDLLGQHPDLEHALFQRVLRDLDSAREWMFLLGCKSAEEKVASFLCMIAEKMGQAAHPRLPTNDCTMLILPLSRTEIAECLSLRLETVSRQFTILKARGIIETRGRRQFRVRDMGALKAYSEAQALSA